MKKFVLTIVGIAALVGCRHSVTGTLDVSEQIMLNKTNGSAITLEEGSYKATVRSYDKKDKIVFKIDGKKKSESGNAEFKTPENMVIPQNGHITLDSETSGQPWDLEGEIATEVTVGPKVSTYESCHYGTAFWHCSGFESTRLCGWWYDTYYHGVRAVEYHKEKAIRSVTVDLLDPSTSDTVASFEGDKTVNSEIVYDFIGSCQ